MADHREAAVTLPSTPASVSAARDYAAGVLGQWGLPEHAPSADAVRLIVSELATNAVLHTGRRSPAFTVELRLDRDEELHIGVTDSDPGRPRRRAAAVRQDNGRGMAIVRYLAAESGGRLTVTPTPDGGKTVWIAMPWRVPAQ